MTPDRPTPPSRPGRSEPWRIERMVQHVPPHLGETTRQPVSPWIVIAGAVLLIVVSCGVLFVLLNVPDRLRALGAPAAPTATRTPRVVTPAVTVVPTIAVPSSPTPGPTAATVKYKVKQNDTLSGISTRYRVSVDAIKAANGLTGDMLHIDQELIIPLPTPTPSGGAQAPQPTAAEVVAQLPVLSTPTAISLLPSPPAPSPATTPGTITYSVTQGDTLGSIAANYGSTVDAIKSANRLTSDMLSIGQALIVPVAMRTPTPATVALVPRPPTPTAQFAYAAPNLLFPGEGEDLSGKTLTFGWTAPATLKAGDHYVLHIEYRFDGQNKSFVKDAGQATSYSLKPADVPGAGAGATDFQWYVVIVNQSADASTQVRADLVPGSGGTLSPSSEVRTFGWH